MQVVFLGYNLVDFVNDDGQSIKGLKFFFYFESEKRNYHGYEVASCFKISATFLEVSAACFFSSPCANNSSTLLIIPVDFI